MKEMVLAGISGTAGSSGGNSDNRLVLTKLEEVEANLIGSQSWLADVMMAAVKYAVGAKYQAEMGTQNSDEIISLRQIKSH